MASLKRLGFLFDYLGLIAVLMVLTAIFGVSSENFLTLSSFKTIANQIPDAIIIAVGMTLVLIIAGIDLSVGSVLALSGAILSVCFLNFNLSLPWALLACLATGLLCGAVNGAMVVTWRLPAFIVTLGMLEAARGAAYLATDSQPKFIGPVLSPVTETGILGLSLPFLIAFAVVIGGQVLLSCTVFGRHMFTVGANEEAARLSGVNTAATKVAVYAISGLLSGLAAFIYCSRLLSFEPNAGSGYELNAIAAVVIGGTSLMGGRGSVVKTFFGVLIIAVLESGLAHVGAPEHVKKIVTGGVIVAAVIMDYYRNRLRKTA